MKHPFPQACQRARTRVHVPAVYFQDIDKGVGGLSFSLDEEFWSEGRCRNQQQPDARKSRLPPKT